MPRPTPAEVRRARKAELVTWCNEFGLDAEGKVDELRERLLTYFEVPEEPAKREPTPAAKPKEEEPAEEPGKGAEVEEEPEEEAEAEAEEKGEEGKAFTPKLKPTLGPDVRALLRLRLEMSRRRPKFRRQEWFRYARLGELWRKPQGMHSKLKRHFGYRPNVVSVGYRGPRSVRGLHPSGFREVLVHTTKDLERLDPKREAARIAGTVGTRRRLEIQAAADEKGIRVLNRREEE